MSPAWDEKAAAKLVGQTFAGGSASKQRASQAAALPASAEVALHEAFMLVRHDTSALVGQVCNLLQAMGCTMGPSHEDFSQLAGLART